MGIEKIDAVLITYKPNIELLNKVVKSILFQVRKLYLIDNTPGMAKCVSHLDEYENIEVIYLYDNKGIAHAQNVGIKKSIKNKSDYILLSDQDTIYPKNYIIDMIKAIHKLDNNIAAIAPLYKDLNKKDSDTGFIKKSFTGVKKFYPDSGFHEIYQAIASGKILITKHLSRIGLMDEKLFIDRVDMEWCWRAINKGYKIIGNANVVISHYMGDKVINIGFKLISLRSPIRTYYMIRNDVHLALRCKSLYFVHRIIVFLRPVLFLIAMPLLAKPHSEHLKYALLGFRHGLTGELGKLDGTS